MDAVQEIKMINIDNIIPNRFQPRLTFDEQGLNELASSIKEHGIIQPLVLRKLGDKYEIVAGERRYKASTIAGLTEVPAIISDFDDNQSAEVALVENVQRRNLTSIEEAKSYKKILDKGYLTQEQLAKKMGVSQSTVANKLRLLNLSIPVQEALLNERISERHARSLLQITDITAQENMLNRVMNERMTVRQLDTAIKSTELPNEELKIEEPIETFQPEDQKEEMESIETIQTENQEEEIEPMETLDIFPSNEILEPLIEEPIQKTSKLLNIFDKPDYPSLEDEQVNLSLDLSSEELFEDLEEPIIDEEVRELLELVPETSIIKKEEPKIEKRIVENDLNSVITSFKDLESEIKEAGFKIVTEEFDFEDLYQVIIKIDKQAE